MKKLDVVSLFQKRTNKNVSDIFEIENRGEVNKIFVLSAEEQEYVLRFDPGETTVKRFEKEQWCMETASKQGVLTPKVFEVGLHQKQPYMLMEYLEGASGDSAEDKNLIWRKLGEYARLIEGIQTAGYGEGMTTPGVFNDTWERFIEYNITRTGNGDRAVALGLLTQEEADLLKNIFIELADKPPAFGLLHYDLSLDNIIVADGEVYLIDWGSAQVGPVPHLDIAEVLHSSLKVDSIQFSQFLKGYDLSRNEFESLGPEILKVDLLMHADKLRWALDCREDLITQFTKAVKQRIPPLK